MEAKLTESSKTELVRYCFGTYYQIFLDFPESNSKVLLVFQIQDLNTIHVLFVARLTEPISFDQLYDLLMQSKAIYTHPPCLLVCSPERVLMEASLAVHRDSQVIICLESLLRSITKQILTNPELEKDITNVLHQPDLNHFINVYSSAREKWNEAYPVLMEEIDSYMPFLIPMYQYKQEIRPILCSVGYAKSQLNFIHHFLSDYLDQPPGIGMDNVPYQINSYLLSFPLEINSECDH